MSALLRARSSMAGPRFHRPHPEPPSIVLSIGLGRRPVPPYTPPMTVLLLGVECQTQWWYPEA
jgi:hypothetical protein